VTESRFPGPAGPTERGRPLRDRELGSTCPDQHQDAAVEAGIAGVKLLQRVDGRKAVFGIAAGRFVLITPRAILVTRMALGVLALWLWLWL
jgi:hypothetical protein